MSEVNAKQLFDDWDVSTATSTQKANGYEYALDSLERLGWLTTATLVAVTALTGTYSFPTGAVRLLKVFYDDRELLRESRRALRSDGGADWFRQTGSPIAYTEDQELDQVFRVYPIPEQNSASFTYPNGEPFGRDYPRNALVTVASMRDDVPAYMEAIAALWMIQYARSMESKSQDLEFAAALNDLIAFLTNVVARA